jgi:hypothetical protein
MATARKTRAPMTVPAMAAMEVFFPSEAGLEGEELADVSDVLVAV